MKLAILLMCHKLPEQIKMFVETMKNDNITIFIHIDKKSNINQMDIENNNVYILPDKYRKDVRWAQISQIDAILTLLEFARKKDNFDYYWLCSGQDYPIRSPEYILKTLERNPKVNYLNLFTSFNNGLGKNNKYDKRNQITFHKWMLSRNLGLRILKRAVIELTGGYNKTFQIFQRKNTVGMNFYFGSEWWCLNSKTIEWILNFLKKNRDYYQFFSACSTPDESFFHTLVMNSPYMKNIQDYLHYVDWSEDKSSPKTLTMEDFPKIEKSGKLMARKFDIKGDRKIIEELPIIG